MGYPAELVFGTLDEPVHAGNLHEALVRVENAYPGATILAVDACLGSPENVGSISLCDGPVRPGAGVNKNLPPVGQLSVTGVVNVAGFMEYFVLQNTRLSLVVRMARAIARAIVDAIGHRADIWDSHGAHSGGGSVEQQLREPAACGEVALTDSRS
jgi:putative sporulation protein YyaC